MRKVFRVVAVAASVALISIITVHTGFAAFELGCELLFDEIKGDDPVASCPNHGSATAPEQQAQNRAKNNLCATGAPVNLTFQHFIRLQKAAETAGITFGSHARVPEDRNALKNLIVGPGGRRIGEGSVVR